MRALYSALPLLTLTMLPRMSVGRCDAAVPPSLSVVNLPVTGSVMASDAQGNILFTSGAQPAYAVANMFGSGVAGGLPPVTPGAAQVQPGGGTCGQTPGIPIYPAPCRDAYIAKVQVSGSGSKLVFGTLLGGDKDDVGTGIAVDSVGNVYVTGTTGGNFPTTPNAFLRSMPAGDSAVFVAKVNPQGSQFLYATYLPGGAAASGLQDHPPPAIAVDKQGNAYVTGRTGSQQAFVAKLSADGSALLYNTVLRGSSSAAGLAITVDGEGNAYVTGQTLSNDFPVSLGAFQTHLSGCQPSPLIDCSGNAFVAKLDPSGNVIFATYLGGSRSEAPNAIQVDSAGYVYVAGATTSLDFPTTPGSYEPIALIPMWSAYTDDPGGFAAKLSPALDKLAYSTYIFSDRGVSNMILDNAGGSWLAGLTGAGMPVTASAPQPCLVGGEDIFVTHLDQHGALLDRSYFNDGVFFTPMGLTLSGDRSIRFVASTESVGSPWSGALAELRFGDPGVPAAACLSTMVLNGATLFSSPPPGGEPWTPGPVSPGEFISLTGFGIGPEQGVSYQRGPDGSVPRQLAGVQVFFDDLPAPLLYVQSQQINAIAPFEVAGRTTTRMQVMYNGATIGSVDLPVAFANPGLFRLHVGLSNQAAAVNEDGTINGPSNPAKIGSVVSLFGTGFGQSDPPGVTGARSPLAPSRYQATVTVFIASSLTAELNGEWAPAEVLYAGPAPGELAGIGQVNIRVPAPRDAASDAVLVSVNAILPNGQEQGSSVQSTIFVK